MYFRVGRVGYALVNDANAIARILQDVPENYPKGPGYERLRSLIGEGLLTSEGEHWQRQRRLMAPAFSQHAIAAACGEIARLVHGMFAAWDARLASTPRLDLAVEMSRIALLVAGRVLLGSDLTARADDIRIALQEALAFAEGSGLTWGRLIDLLSPWGDRNLAFAVARRLPTAGSRRFADALRTLDEVVTAIIEQHRRDDSAGADLLGVLLDARRRSALTERQLRDEVLTLLLAGHETTATAITWTWHALCSYPAIAEAVRAEADRVIGERACAAGDFSRLTYTRQVFDEALRCYPPFWRFTRQSTAPGPMLDYWLPGRTVFIVSPYLVHRNPRYWDAPQRFDPQRFARGTAAARPRGSYIPFGVGPRGCLAANLAYAEALVIIGLTVRRYRFTPLQAGSPRMRAAITLRPRDGLQVEVARR